jgi:hypothetical protein
MKWLASEFDFVAGRYTGAYYDWTSFASVVFVDSELGDDSFVGGGTEANPWKTLTKAHNDIGTVTGTRIVINGIFTENLNITKQVRIIGAGGGRNGRAIFNNGGGVNYVRLGFTNNYFLENIETINYPQNTNIFWNTALTNNAFFVNCVLGVFFRQTTNNQVHNSFFCIYNKCGFSTNNTAVSGIYIYGNNNTFYDTISYAGTNVRRLLGDNNHTNENLVLWGNSGSNNLINVDGQYFSPANNDFNFPDTSPLYLTGTVDGITGIPNNVGAGRLGDFLNPSKYQYTTGGGAVFTNTEIDGTDIYRTDDLIDGTFRTGIVDMGQIRRGVVIGINNTFQFTGGELTKLIQETTGLTVRQGLDWKLIYGNSINEIQTKITANEWLLMEYGKMVTVTIDGVDTYGNADASFDPTDFIIPSFRMFVVEMRFKNA